MQNLIMANSLFYIPGTVGGAFVVDFFGPKWTMVSVVSLCDSLLCLNDSFQIIGLLSQAVIGFIMSGLYSHLTNHIAAFAVGIFL